MVVDSKNNKEPSKHKEAGFIAFHDAEKRVETNNNKVLYILKLFPRIWKY